MCGGGDGGVMMVWRGLGLVSMLESGLWSCVWSVVCVCLTVCVCVVNLFRTKSCFRLYTCVVDNS